MPVLPLSLQTTVQDIILQSNFCGGTIRCILLSTTEGVPLGRFYNNTVMLNNSNNNIDPNDNIILGSIESTWAPSSKQYPIFGCGRLKQITVMYDHGTLVQIYQSPLVITILCEQQCNVGAIRSTTVPLLQQVLEPLSKELVTMLQVVDHHHQHEHQNQQDANINNTTTNTSGSIVQQQQQQQQYGNVTYYQ